MSTRALSNTAQARGCFLENAAGSLLAQCPVVSAHLARAKITVLDQTAHGRPEGSETNKCLSCGVLLLPGWTCEQIRRPRSKNAPKRTTRETKSMQVRCSLCNTKAVLQRSRRRPRSTLQPMDLGGVGTLVSPLPMIVSHEERQTMIAQPQPSQAQQTSRKKARNKNNSLQALLGKKKAEPASNSGFGLGFADLLKS